MKKISDNIPTQVRLAEEIRVTFNLPCSKQTVQAWQKQMNPPFPSPGKSGYSRRECFKWIVEVYLPGAKAIQTTPDLDARARQAAADREIDRARSERVKADEAEKRVIDRALAVRTVKAAFRLYHAITKKIITEAVTAEQAAQIIQRIEDECERQGREGIQDLSKA